MRRKVATFLAVFGRCCHFDRRHLRLHASHRINVWCTGASSCGKGGSTRGFDSYCGADSDGLSCVGGDNADERRDSGAISQGTREADPQKAGTGRKLLKPLPFLRTHEEVGKISNLNVTPFLEVDCS